MKKIAYLLMTCLGVLMLTSCLGNSESETTIPGQDYFKVSDTYGGCFVGKNLTIIPSVESRNILAKEMDFRKDNGNLFFVIFQKVVKGGEEFNDNTLSGVDIIWIRGLNAPVFINNNEAKSELPFLDLEKMPEPRFYDDHTLLMNVNYELLDSKHLHTVYAVYDENEQKEESIVLNLYNDAGKDQQGKNTEGLSLEQIAEQYNDKMLMQKAFRLEEVIRRHNSKYNKHAENVIFNYKVKVEGKEGLEKKSITVSFPDKDNNTIKEKN